MGSAAADALPEEILKECVIGGQLKKVIQGLIQRHSGQSSANFG